MWKKALISASAIVCLAGAVNADPDAVDRLMKSAQAIKDAKSLSYDIHVTMTGFISTDVKGAVEMRRRATGSWDVRREGKATMSGMGAAQGTDVNFLVVSNPSTVMWIDMDKQKVVERYARQARDQRVTTAETAWISAINENEPYSKDLAAPTSKVEGEITLDGVKCDIVFVDDGDNREQRRWFLGQEDRLPRKLEATLSGQAGMSMVRTYVVTNLKVNPTLADERFDIVTPEGFTEERLPKSNPNANQNEPIGQTNTPIMAPIAPARIAPRFSVAKIDGAEFTNDGLNEKVTVLLFGGTWNRAWKLETEALAPVFKEFKGQGVQVVSAAIKQSKLEDMADHFKSHGAEAIVVSGADNFARDIGCKSFPTLFVIDAKSRIIHEERGYNAETTVNAVREAIEKALKGEEPAAGPTPDAAGDAGDGAGLRRTTTTGGDGTSDDGKR